MPTITSINATADSVAAGLSKDAALKVLKASVEKALKATGKFTIKPGEKQGFLVDAKIVSLATDDKAAPKKLKVSIAIKFTYMGGATKVISGTTGGEKEGINAKKLDAAAAELIDAVVASQLHKDGKLVKAVAP